MKTCTKCGASKPLEEFYKDSRKGDGRCSDCKKCSNARGKAYRKAHPEKVKAFQEAYRKAHPEKCRAWSRINSIRAKERREANPEECRAYGRARYAAHAEECRAARRAYYKAHPEKNKACTKAWRKANKKKRAAYVKAYYKAHPEQCAEYSRERRARKLGASIGEQPVLTNVVVARDGNKCYLCGKRLKKSERTLDHVIPLSKGGEHSYENVLLCCQPCNSSKSARLPHEHTRSKNLEAASGDQLQLLSPGGDGR